MNEGEFTEKEKLRIIQRLMAEWVADGRLEFTGKYRTADDGTQQPVYRKIK